MASLPAFLLELADRFFRPRSVSYGDARLRVAQRGRGEPCKCARTTEREARGRGTLVRLLAGVCTGDDDNLPMAER